MYAHSIYYYYYYYYYALRSALLLVSYLTFLNNKEQEMRQSDRESHMKVKSTCVFVSVSYYCIECGSDCGLDGNMYVM